MVCVNGWHSALYSKGPHPGCHLFSVSFHCIGWYMFCGSESVPSTEKITNNKKRQQSSFCIKKYLNKNRRILKSAKQLCD